MKNLLGMLVLSALLVAAFITNAAFTTVETANDEVTVILENNCGEDVRVRMDLGNNWSSTTIYKGKREKYSLEIGSKIEVDGDYLDFRLSSSHEGKTIYLCD